jgi:putative molybdopterin biosynthesis protein
METGTHLKEIRDRRGISVAALAKLTHITRQTIYAIEAGNYIPNTTVALQLAKILEVRIEELFSLEPETTAAPKPGPVGSSCPCAPANPYGSAASATAPLESPPHRSISCSLPADGIVVDNSKAQMVQEPEDQKRVIAGCDPGISLLAQQLDFVIAPLRQPPGLAVAKAGEVHVGRNASTRFRHGRLQHPHPKASLPEGNRQCGDLRDLGTRLDHAGRKSDPRHRRSGKKRRPLINREKGAAAATFSISTLHAAGIPPDRVTGYERIASGHLSAAAAVKPGRSRLLHSNTVRRPSLSGLRFIL